MVKIIKGYVQAMKGEELLINTTTDEMIRIVVKNREERWKLYCNEVKITIETQKGDK